MEDLTWRGALTPASGVRVSGQRNCLGSGGNSDKMLQQKPWANHPPVGPFVHGLMFSFILSFFFLNDVYLTYNIILVSAVQHNDLTLQNDQPALGSEKQPFIPMSTTLPAASLTDFSASRFTTQRNREASREPVREWNEWSQTSLETKIPLHFPLNYYHDCGIFKYLAVSLPQFVLIGCYINLHSTHCSVKKFFNCLKWGPCLSGSLA